MLTDLPLDQLHHRAAVSAVASGVTATISVSAVAEVVQIIAGVMAILSACMAIRYYYVSTKKAKESK